MTKGKAVDISVVVPVLHEASRAPALVRELARQAAGDGLRLQVVVVDADPEGSTLSALAGLEEVLPGRVEVLCELAGQGRAVQMNAGARLADGEVLLFLHADTRLPEQGLLRAVQTLGTGLAHAGAFDLQFDRLGAGFELVACLARLRSRLERCPYGDQAHFFRRAVFFGLGGYPEIPLMEDVELMWTLRRRAIPLCILPERVTTSARRYERDGLARRVLRNAGLRLRHALGADPARLAGRYPAQEEPRT